MHTVSDALIWLAYMAIPALLVYFVRRKRSLPFSGVFWMFGLFIVSCGFTHLIEVVLFSYPVYRLSGLVKAVTAVASWATLFTLAPLLPKALALRTPDELEKEIGERKRTEEALRESEERFREAFDHASIGMALLSLDGRWMQVNRSLCDITGYGEEELLAKTFQDITHPDDLDADLAHVRELLAGEISTYQMEKRYFHKDGRIVWALLSVSLVHDADGRPASFISQIQDITARKEAEGERERLIRELREALSTVKTLKGLLPICAWCKLIRNDEGYWKHLEEYIRDHLDVNFTHGMCPACFAKQFPNAPRSPAS